MQRGISCWLGMRLLKNRLCFNPRTFSSLAIRNTAVEVQTRMMIRNVCTAERAVYLADANKNADVQQFYSHFSTNWFSESDQGNLAYVPTNCCFHVDCRNDDNSRFFDGKEGLRTLTKIRPDHTNSRWGQLRNLSCKSSHHNTIRSDAGSLSASGAREFDTKFESVFAVDSVAPWSLRSLFWFKGFKKRPRTANGK